MPIGRFSGTAANSRCGRTPLKPWSPAGDTFVILLAIVELQVAHHPKLQSFIDHWGPRRKMTNDLIHHSWKALPIPRNGDAGACWGASLVTLVLPHGANEFETDEVGGIDSKDDGVLERCTALDPGGMEGGKGAEDGLGWRTDDYG
ncbi:hypothetical protein M405DRAFT_910618 [Rhizopogon salebrosus TDB-379]|nr:hypothetical protein M405DRAFT_910618 [Rhizopogon salebrosus TDB-379]